MLYALVAICTTHSYGVAPDNPYNYFRGERIFQYFLTGNRQVLDWWTNKDEYTPYESIGHPKFVRIHPDFPETNPGGGYSNSFGYIASAVTCYIFYRSLRLTDAVTAHKLSNIFFGVLIICFIYWFAAAAINPLAGFFSALAITLYPKLFVLVQGNIKDIPMLSMYVLTIWAGWYAIERENWRWLCLSALALGLSVGCKSTGGFAFFVLLIYFLVRQIYLKCLPSRKFLLALLFCPLISCAAIYASNPNYWPIYPGAKPQTNTAVPEQIAGEKPSLLPPETHSPASIITNLWKEFSRAISTNSLHSNWQDASMPGWTTIRARYAFFATPVITIFLALIGVAAGSKKSGEDGFSGYYLLLLIWLFTPLFRTAIPYSIAYGGIRLYVDYVPPLCLLAGMGAFILVDWLKGFSSLQRVAPYLVLAGFIPITYKVTAIHPYEVAYFNFLIGGNKGAMESHYPEVGDNQRTTCPEAIEWLNHNAEQGARVLVANTHLLNGFGLRSDLKAFLRQEETKGAEYVYAVIFPTNWSYKKDIPWPESERILVRETRIEDSPILLIYKHKMSLSKI